LDDSTHELIRQSKTGNMQAFRQLVENHQTYAFNLAFRILRCEEDARDSVQESFIRVWRHLPKFNMKKKFTTWLYRIVVNQALDRLRQRKRRSEVSLSGSDSPVFPDPRPNPEESVIHAETMETIQLAVDQLPLKQRLVFIIRDLQGLGVHDVAEILKCSKQNVKSNLFHARKNIRKQIESGENL